MKPLDAYWWRILLLATLSLFVLVSFPGSAFAQEAFQGNYVGPSETIENDIILNGDNIDLDGTVEGDVLALGRNITIDGTITGSLVAVGERITISGEVGGSVYAVAVSLNLEPTGTVAHNVHFIGLTLITQAGSEIGRDLVAVSLGANVRGTVARDTRLIIGAIEIARLIMRQIGETTTGKSLDEEARLFMGRPTTATLERPGGALFAVLSQEESQPEEEGEEEPGNPTVEWLLDHLRGFITYLLIGLLAIWLLPRLLDRWAERLRLRPLIALGAGIVVYVVGFVGALIMLVLVIGVFIGLLVLTLTDLAFITFGISLSGLALAFSVFLLFVSYLSKIIVAYLVGRLILGRLLPRSLTYRIWPLLLGLFLYVLVCAIPILGWVVGLLVTFFGLGTVWLAFNDQRKLDALPA